MPVTAHDVAAAVLARYRRPMSAMKLQKLVYYCQAWHLVWTGRPLFRERIEAWANGPVVVDLFRRHRGRYEVSDWPTGDPSRLTAQQLATVESVVATYGPRSAQALSELTHAERPWTAARRGLRAGERSSAVIQHEQMRRYYSGLGGAGRP